MTFNLLFSVKAFFKAGPALFLLMFVTSCDIYRRDILFKADRQMEKEFAKNSSLIKTPANYQIGKNDILEFMIFTNKGESVIDPTSEYLRQVNANNNANGRSGAGTGRYLIQADGCADLPILGHVKLDSLTMHQVDSLLSVKYGQFYQDVFVLSKVANRRIFVLGIGSGGVLGAGMGANAGLGGGGNASRSRVFELERENVTLIEVLTEAGGIGRYGYANRVKVIRGDLRNPTIFTVDLTKWDSFQKSNMIMQPNDIVYVEPLRRGSLEFFTDFLSLTSIFSTVLSVYLITRL
jgi:polysaccharide export outer membrane protein